VVNTVALHGARDVPDIRFQLAGYLAIFFESGSGSGSGQNGTSYRISQPDSARSFLAVCTAGEVITEHRARLLPDNAERQIFLFEVQC